MSGLRLSPLHCPVERSQIYHLKMKADSVNLRIGLGMNVCLFDKCEYKLALHLLYFLRVRSLSMDRSSMGLIQGDVFELNELMGIG